MIDTHCHLNFSDYEKDLEEVIRRSLGSGVNKIICASSDLKSSKRAVEIAKVYPGIVYPAAGIHPQQTDPENKTSLTDQIQALKQLADTDGITAIGECGLDYSPAPPGEADRTKEEQIFIFEEQIKIAKSLNLPIIVHTRKAFEDTVEILKRYQDGSLRGVFHCYTGGKKGITKVLDLGFYFGIDGNITYDEGLQRVVKEIPLERLLTETDSPFLSPEPFRGRRNEPANISLIIKSISEIKGEELNKVKNVIFQKAAAFFGITTRN